MIKTLNWNLLTPASWAISKATNMDVGVGRSMLLNNIRHGAEIDPIWNGLDPEYMPDWAALKAEYELDVDKAMNEFNVWQKNCQDKYFELVEAWNSEPRDCAKMVELVSEGPVLL